MSKLVKLKQISSTNDWIRINRSNFSDMDGIIAESQFSGRGRGSNRWISPEGGLWMSLLVSRGTGNRGSLIQLTSVAIAEVLEEYEINVNLKWPNDIIYNLKKLGGILIESINDDFILGMGLNLNFKTEVFPRELRDKVITTEEILGRKLPVEDIAEGIKKAIQKGRDDLDRIYAKYLLLNHDLGRMVKIVNKEVYIEGRVVGINKNGVIRIISQGEEKSIYSGSLRYVLN